MKSMLCFLVYVSNTHTLIECALAFPRDNYPHDIEDHPMEYRNIIYEHLPSHVRSYGHIVKIDSIFDVHVVVNEKGTQ